MIMIMSMSSCVDLAFRYSFSRSKEVEATLNLVIILECKEALHFLVSEDSI